MVNLPFSESSSFNIYQILYQNHGHPSTCSTVIQLLWTIWSHDFVSHSHTLAVGMIAEVSPLQMQDENTNLKKVNT